MTNEEIRKMKHAEPFAPFDLHLASGRVLRIPHPEFVYVPPITTRTIVVTDEHGIVETINVLLIESIRPVSNGRRRRAG